MCSRWLWLGFILLLGIASSQNFVSPTRQQIQLNGIGLGMTSEKVKVVLGKPSATLRDRRSLVWSWGEVRVQFVSDRVVRVEGSRLSRSGAPLQATENQLGPATHNHRFGSGGASMQCWEFSRGPISDTRPGFRLGADPPKERWNKLDGLGFLIESVANPVGDGTIIFLTSADCPEPHLGGCCCGSF